ncbi:MAG: TnsA endonuclease N-terminal domain-containing protein [Photobacterium frigidiphilum]|uniref:TnsA endonuclease N-terminal domain-containing protein n=1 Tax=Photobacterium frigidiphilum TaxID=264736 RepID=UPI003002D1AA
MYEKRTLKNSSVKNISRFVSIKTDSIHTVESDLEFDACFHFEFASEILMYEAQPLGFEYMLNGKSHRYMPDFLCLYADGYQPFYEIKPKYIVESDEYQEVFSAQQKQAVNMGQDLRVLTEDDIQIYPLLENLKVIHRYACDDNLDAVQYQILQLFQKYGELRINQVVEGASLCSAVSLPALYDLIAKRLLNFDWHCSGKGKLAVL